MNRCRRENNCCCPPERPPLQTPGCSGCLLAVLLIAFGGFLLLCLFCIFP